jgi:hypothetical protein
MLADEAIVLRQIIADRNKTIHEQEQVIAQYAVMAREQAITIARLRVGRENDSALARAVAARDARQYAEGMRRSPVGNAR